MQIKRNYSEPFFGHRRRKWTSARLWMVFGLLAVIAFIAFLYFTRFDQLREAAMEVIGQSPTATPQPSELATRASDLFLTGNLEGAATLFAQVVNDRPDEVSYLYEYGQVLAELDRYDEVIDLADRALEIDSNDPRGYALKIRALALSGNSASAISLGAVALALDPTFAPLHAALARAYTDSARYAEALDHGLRAVELDPFYHDAHRSYAYALTSVRENEQAISELQQTIALHPALAAPYFELAYQYLALNMDQEAIDTYAIILSLQPRNPKALLRQCEAYRKIGQFERALGYCEDSVRANPAYAPAQFQLGLMLYNRREFPQALAAFQQCYNVEPDNLECYYRLGLAHYYLQACDEAWTILQESLIMAQIRIGLDETVSTIREGLTAVSRDCPAYSGRVTPIPEVTQETG